MTCAFVFEPYYSDEPYEDSYNEYKEDFLEKYNEEYFEKYALLIVQITTPGKCSVKNITIDESNAVSIVIKEKVYGVMGSNTYMLKADILRKYLDNVTEVSLTLESK